MSIRSFFALPVSVEVEEELAEFSLTVESILAPSLNPNASLRWVPPENYHLTLAFLGNIERRNLERLGQIATEVAAQFRAGHYQLDRCEWFPSAVKPRLLVVSPTENPALMKLQKTLCQFLNREGFHVEKRAFRPHITLARVKDIAQPLDLAALKPDICGEMDELVLFSSEQDRQGPIYSPLLVEPITG